MSMMQTRRRFLTTLSLAGAARLMRAPRALATEAAPETTTVRLAKNPGICIAPQYIAEELLRMEGFTDIRYVDQAPGATEPIARGKADGGLYRFQGRLRELPDIPFKSVMTPVEEQPLPIAGGGGEGGAVDGLYSIHLRALDGVDGGLTGVMLLNDGRILGGDASFF